MSRSYKKTPIYGHTCAKSDKKDKQLANRKHRHTNKTLVRQGKEPKELRELSNEWDFNKDGKWYDNGNNEKLKRK